MKSYVGEFKSVTNESLYYQFWAAKGPARFGVVITHGHSEHAGCYHRFIDKLLEAGAQVWIWDLLGHGKSEGIRGYAPSFNTYVEDLAQFLKLIPDSKVPLFLFAHSMGGLIQTKFLAEHNQDRFIGQILSGPWFGLSQKVPAALVALAEALAIFAPKVTISNQVNYSHLSRDPIMLAEFERDPLRHEKICAPVFIGANRAISELKSKADRIQLPTLLVMSDHDPVTNTEAAEKFFDLFSSQNKKKILYADRCHELLNDYGREQVLADIFEWIDGMLGSV